MDCLKQENLVGISNHRVIVFFFFQKAELLAALQVMVFLLNNENMLFFFEMMNMYLILSVLRLISGYVVLFMTALQNRVLFICICSELRFIYQYSTFKLANELDIFLKLRSLPH